MIIVDGSAMRGRNSRANCANRARFTGRTMSCRLGRQSPGEGILSDIFKITSIVEFSAISIRVCKFEGRGNKDFASALSNLSREG